MFLTIIGHISNLLCAVTLNILPLGIPIESTEDTMEKIGFGIKLINQKPSIGSDILTSKQLPDVNFDIVSFAITFGIIFVLVLLIKIFIGKARKNKL